MDAEKLYRMMRDLKEIFDVVRLVDINRMEICDLGEDGSIIRKKYTCYAVWGRRERCMNCISAKVCTTKGRLEKFEFVNNDIYHVISQYIRLNDGEYALELVTKTNDETLFEAYGKGPFVKAICEMNEKMYTDELTGLKNRRYYQEQRARLEKAPATALIDIDNFKQLNDTYGHAFGDQVLKAVSDTVLGLTEKNDTVIRYGGDEICIFLEQAEEADLRPRLERICQKTRALSFPGKPELRVSVSIGGYLKEQDGENPFAVVDRMLYLAKQKKDCVQI